MRQLTKDEALRKAQSLCAKREYCRSEIKKKLFQWQVRQEDVEDIILSLTADRFIDENRYVEFFVKDKFNLNKWGKIKIEYALKSKGIAQEIIQKHLNKINNNTYFETCKTLIINKLSSLKGREDNLLKLKEKTIRFAQSRGFEASLVYEIYESIDANPR